MLLTPDLGNQHLGLSFRAGQNDLGTPHQAVRQREGAGRGLQLLFLFLSETDGNWGRPMGMGPLLILIPNAMPGSPATPERIRNWG